MNKRATLVMGIFGALLVSATAIFTPACTCGPRRANPPPTPVKVTPENYGGWKNAFRVRNATAEFVVVPQIGRVMSFRFLDGENVFWEDRSLDGKSGDPSGREWVNFGGDKTWPAPEGDWGKHTGYKEWMPPPGFDGAPSTGEGQGTTIVLTTAIDPFYGVRAVRRIWLEGDKPELTITTTYERVSGSPAKVGVWIITQFKNPERVYVPLASNSTFENGFYTFPGPPWPQLTKTNGTVVIARDSQASHKMACDGDRLLWVGKEAMCLVVSRRSAGGDYPDRGASAEVYTNPDPKPYVELEMLGPLSTMKVGDKITQVNSYKLMRRTMNDPDADARHVLSLR